MEKQLTICCGYILGKVFFRVNDARNSLLPVCERNELIMI